MSPDDLLDYIRGISNKEKILTFSLTIILLITPLIVLSSISREKKETRSQAQEISIESLNTKILLNNKTGKKGENKSLLEQRKKQMLKLAKENPREFLSKAIIKETRESFPQDQKALIEEKASLSGELVSYHSDDFDKKVSKKGYMIRTKDIIYGLNIADDSPDKILEAGIVALDPYVLDNQLVAESGNITYQTTFEPSGALGVIPFMVIPINFINDRSRPYTISQIRRTFFGENNSLSEYYSKLSNGRSRIIGDVHSWVELDNVRKGEICEDAGRNQALSETRRIYDAESYRGVIFVFPPQECNWAGIATVGGYPSWSFIDRLEMRTISHEIGHNLNLVHANLVRCHQGGCREFQYGDKSDTMGDSFAGMNNSHLRALRFLRNSSIREFTSNGRYRVYKQGSGSYPQSIKFDIPSDPWDIYIEYRGRKAGYDENVPYPLGAGILIYEWDGHPWHETKLIDITPLDNNPNNLVVRDGQSERLTGITVRQISHDGDFALISIRKN